MSRKFTCSTSKAGYCPVTPLNATPKKNLNMTVLQATLWRALTSVTTGARYPKKTRYKAFIPFLAERAHWWNCARGSYEAVRVSTEYWAVACAVEQQCTESTEQKCLRVSFFEGGRAKVWFFFQLISVVVNIETPVKRKLVIVLVFCSELWIYFFYDNPETSAR